MENIISSTAYVPLQPPYQIIKYSGDIAMQIGTLIVTAQKKGKDYAIETHSHPVVAYGDKTSPELANRQLSGRYFLEGTVWNHVEVKDVTTICLSGAKLKWEEFLQMLETECVRESYKGIPQISMFWELIKVGVKILPPEERECTIDMFLTIHPEETGISLRSKRGSLLFLNVSVAEDDLQNGIENVFYNEESYTWGSHKWKDDKQVLNELGSQLQQYRHVLRYLLIDAEEGRFTITYKTAVKEFSKLINSLNLISEFVNLSYIS